MSRTVYIYGIFFSNKRLYIGSTIHPKIRLRQHNDEVYRLSLNRYKHNVWRKYGLNKFVVFKQTTDESGRKCLEQTYFDFFAKRGYELVNAITPEQSTASYMFAGLTEHRLKCSNAAKRRFMRPEEHRKT